MTLIEAVRLLKLKRPGGVLGNRSFRLALVRHARAREKLSEEDAEALTT